MKAPRHIEGQVAEPLRVLVAGWPNSPHVLSWAEALSSLGHDVHVVGRAPPQWPEVSSGAKVHVLSAEGPRALRSDRMRRALTDVAADVQPDLVHAHWLPEMGWMAAREGLRPLVCSSWGSDVFGVRGIGRRRSKIALSGSELVMADSIHLARATRELAGRDVPVEVVRWGLDLDRFSPGETSAAREALGLGQDGPLVVSVRGFDGIYNPELLLDAFVCLRTLRADACLLLKHSGDTTPPSLTRAVDRLGLGERVSVLANVPPDQMPNVYRAADVVVSIPSSDSSPRSVWEALACGRPVVVSDLPWARDELEDGRHALLTALDATSIAHAINRALDEDRLGAEGRALARAELDPEMCAARINVLYKSVVNSAP